MLMRPSDLHPLLRKTAVPVPNHSGTVAVIPPEIDIEVPFKDCDTLSAIARLELDRLKSALADFSGAAKLMYALNRREAVDSSQIEGTRTQFSELLLYELDAAHDVANTDDALTTLNYVSAYALGVEQITKQGQDGFTNELILALHRQLLNGHPRTTPGEYRLVQNWIGGMKIENAIYIPPPAEQIPQLMTSLTRFMANPFNEQVKAPSLFRRATIAHAYFEGIHPFLDGNGRVGRLLLPLLFLADQEPPIHLASFLKIRQLDYVLALESAQKRLDYSPWAKLFLECVIASCRHTQNLISQFSQLKTEWEIALKGFRSDSVVHKIMPLLLGQPVLTVKSIAQQLGVSFVRANKAIDALLELDILRLAMPERQRNRVFHAHAVLNLLVSGLDHALLDARKSAAGI